MNKRTADRATMMKTSIMIFVCDGFWCPMWFTTWQIFFYKFYTCFTGFLIGTFMLTQFIDTLAIARNVAEFAKNSVTLMPTINAFCKALNLLAKRQRIIELLQDLETIEFNDRNYRETTIRLGYERLSKWINAVITINAIVTLECMVLGPTIKNPQERKLPFGVRLPYEPDTEISFWLSFIWEKLSASAVGLANLGNDLLTVSMMMQLSVQLDILSDRLMNVAEDDPAEMSKDRMIKKNGEQDLRRERERRKIVDCVRHHIFIFKLAEEVQQNFVWTFMLQTLVSLAGTCTGAFQLARSTIGDSEFTSAALFIGCMISEAFLYCWFGNEVHLKSLEVGNSAYKMNWLNLRVDNQRDLLKICMRANQPILFTSGPAMPLSNEFFVNILQASYTAFTMLREINVK